jgi:hypothetical protein
MSNKNNKQSKIGSFGDLLKDAGIDANHFRHISGEKTDESQKIRNTSKETWAEIKDSSKLLFKKNNLHQAPLRKNKRSPQNSGSVPDLSCYGSNSTSKKNTLITTPVPVQKNIKVKCNGDLIENTTAFVFQSRKKRIIPKNPGIQLQLSNSSLVDDENEIIIGLDFGTSNTKVVIHDPQRNIFYAVPFYQNTSKNPYIYPCKVYLQNHQYSLEEIGDCYSNLKVPLINDNKTIDLHNAVAFLTLIIRHARGWFLVEHAEIYKNSLITWELNIGLPTATFEENKLNNRFKNIALAAINLAGDLSESISENLIAEYLNKIHQDNVIASSLQIHRDLVNVYPEIGAQVVGFVESDSWDNKNRPFVTMIDIGAGTVDISFFSILGKQKDRRFSFMKNSVEHNGVINLHRERTIWLLEILSENDILSTKINGFLNEISKSTAQLSQIPESVFDYILHLELICDDNIDTMFFQRYKKQINSLLSYTKRHRVPRNENNWLRLPVFLCGGGSRMGFYRSVIEEINQWYPNWLHVELYSLNKPDNLRAPGLRELEYDRLSVAYGLSFPKLGEIIQSNQIPDLTINDLNQKERPIDLTDDG